MVKRKRKWIIFSRSNKKNGKNGLKRYNYLLTHQAKYVPLENQDRSTSRYMFGN